jgi:hypothetical protein
MLANISNILEIEFETKISQDLANILSLKTEWQGYVWEFILGNLVGNWCHVLRSF